MINKRSCNFINHFQQLIVTEPILSLGHVFYLILIVLKRINQEALYFYFHGAVLWNFCLHANFVRKCFKCIGRLVFKRHLQKYYMY